MEIHGVTSGEGALEEAARLMYGFAERTGLTGPATRRYLWTDAFAVCNYLELGHRTADTRYFAMAEGLIERVHYILGRYRADDTRHGWLSGLDEDEAERHPTRGGLRIGKPLPERGPQEPFDARLEWERDGQYFHYLTRWMHALDQTARALRQQTYNVWARELASAAFAGFARTGADGRTRLVWKMSTDLGRLGRPLVASTGQHDAIEGLITFAQLQASAEALAATSQGPRLEDPLERLGTMTEPSDWVTEDPLGIGGLLVDAYRVARFDGAGWRQLGAELLRCAIDGLGLYASSGVLEEPATHRLAFRELGLVLGLRAAERIDLGTLGPASEELGVELARHRPLADALEAFWRSPSNRQSEAWNEHRDIDEVMLATCLLPMGYLAWMPARP